jgi:tetratricopeptide (TPR) repeat protein
MRDAKEAFGEAVDHLGNREFEHAIRAFTEAIELNPNLAVAYSGRGAVYALIGDIDKGIADCNEAIRLAPEEAKFYRTRGLVYRDAGEEAKAKADLAKSLELGFVPK